MRENGKRLQKGKSYFNKTILSNFVDTSEKTVTYIVKPVLKLTFFKAAELSQVCFESLISHRLLVLMSNYDVTP